MAVKITHKPKPHSLNLSSLSKKVVDAGNDFRIRTITRTKNGQDVNGKNFEKYSTKYADDKRDGKIPRSKGKDTSKVDLELSGDMLNSLKVQPTSATSVKVYPTRHSAIGYYHNTGSGVPKREWFGINNQIRASIMKILSRGGLIK